MDKFQFLRNNPKEYHKKSSKHMLPDIENKMKELFTKKNKYFRGSCNSKLGKLRRTYYHDNKYIDFWTLSSRSHKKIRTEDICLPSLSSRDKNPITTRAWKLLTDIKIKQGTLKCEVPTSEKKKKIETEIIEETVYIKNKKLYKPKNKFKLIQYSYTPMSTQQALFRNLCEDLY